MRGMPSPELGALRVLWRIVLRRGCPETEANRGGCSVAAGQG